jgi:hypothetical protein
MSAKGEVSRVLSPRLSHGEKEAERIYNLVAEGRLSKVSFMKCGISLEKRSPLGAAYLKWLLLRAFNK